MLRNRWIVFVIFVVLGGASGSVARADTVRMKNGDVLTGKVLSFDSEGLVLTTTYAGDLTIAAGEVASVTTDEPVIVDMGDGREMAGRLVVDAGGGLSVEAEDGGEVALDLSEVSFAPPPPPIPWFRYGGEINLGLNAASGNTKLVGFHVDGAVRPEFGDNAISLKGQLNITDTKIDGNNETTESNWRVLGQYNRFWTEHWYAFVNNGYENDDLKDLNLRISTSAGLGYKFWDDEMRYLTAELGPGYVYENFKRIQEPGMDPDDPSDDFTRNPDRDYAAGRWALDFDHGVFSPDTRFYHNHILLFRLDDPNTFIFQSSTGLKMGLFYGVIAGAEVQFDWNNDPAQGAVEDDLRYMLKIGYGF